MAAITKYIEIILDGGDLTFEQAKDLLDIVFEGGVAEVQVAAFLAAMRMKRATAAEIAGLAKSLREHAVPVKVDIDNLIDTCGTGGATIKTFNISTAAALIAAGAGIYVAKHGNRGITSRCGSADVLAELGVKIDAEPEVIAQCIEQAHIGFMFAPRFHPAMKFVQPIRKSLDFRTAFNILGPLANPAGVTAQVMGVASEALLGRIAETLKILGAKRAMVVHGQGMDEISTLGATQIRWLADGEISSVKLEPADFGISTASIDELKSGDAITNAGIIRDILTGKEKGPRRDIVIINAAAAIMVGTAGDNRGVGDSANLADGFESAIKLAEKSVEGGGAMACLEKLIEISNS